MPPPSAGPTSVDACCPVPQRMTNATAELPSEPASREEETTSGNLRTNRVHCVTWGSPKRREAHGDGGAIVVRPCGTGTSLTRRGESTEARWINQQLTFGRKIW